MKGTRYRLRPLESSAIARQRGFGVKACRCSEPAGDQLPVANAGPVSSMQLTAMAVCLEAVATTGTVPDAELQRLQGRVSTLRSLTSLQPSITKVALAPGGAEVHCGD